MSFMTLFSLKPDSAKKNQDLFIFIEKLIEIFIEQGSFELD